MHPFQLARLGQFGQVPPDRLDRHAEAFCQTLDRDLALGPCDFEDVGMSECLAHGAVSPLSDDYF